MKAVGAAGAIDLDGVWLCHVASLMMWADGTDNAGRWGGTTPTGPRSDTLTDDFHMVSAFVFILLTLSALLHSL